MTLERRLFGAALEGAPTLIGGTAPAVGRTIPTGTRGAERWAIPIAVRGAIPSGPITAKGRTVTAGSIAGKGRALAVAPAAVERGPIALGPTILLLALALERPPTFRARTAKRGPIAPWALAVGAALAILEGPALAVAERGTIPTLLERGPFALLAKRTALPTLERRPFRPPSLLVARLEPGPFRPSALWAVSLERGPFTAPPAFARLIAIIAAREGPVIPLLACVEAALRGSRRLEGPPALLAAFLPAVALSTATGALGIATETPTTAATRPATAGPFIIAAETTAAAAAAGKTAA
ncbi:MAG TPA: hypothetical protein VN837_05330 [Chloroflexota bacterium]|nr:hypothetical protein [Chloroflexota bacterium]